MPKKNSSIYVRSLNFCRRFGNILRFLFSFERPPGSCVCLWVAIQCVCVCGSLVVRCHCCRRWWLLVVCFRSASNWWKPNEHKTEQAWRCSTAPLLFPFRNSLVGNLSVKVYVFKKIHLPMCVCVCAWNVNGNDTWRNDGIIMIELDQKQTMKSTSNVSISHHVPALQKKAKTKTQ